MLTGYMNGVFGTSKSAVLRDVNYDICMLNMLQEFANYADQKII